LKQWDYVEKAGHFLVDLNEMHLLKDFMPTIFCDILNLLILLENLKNNTSRGSFCEKFGSLVE